MKCAKCQAENKDSAKSCRKCGTELNSIVLWRPTWRWHLRTLLIIYGLLLVTFFAANYFLRPYMRGIPANVTPWLNDIAKSESAG